MPIVVREIRAFEGPNLYYPQAAVKLQAWADRDISRQISDTLKNWAQVTGMVIGYLRQYADVALLQLLAEAHAHDVPVLRRTDGHLVVGTGARSWNFDPAGLSLGLGVDVPWDSVGTVPLVAVTGPDAAAVTRLIVSFAERTGRRVGCADEHGIMIVGEQVSTEPSADWDGARRVLTDGRVDVAVVAVSLQSIHERGLGFDECRVSVVTGVNGDERLAEAHGVVVLATAPDGTVVLNADEPAVLALRDWTGSKQIVYTTQELPVEPDETTSIVRSVNDVIRVSSAEKVENIPRRETIPIEHLLPAIAAAHALGIDIATREQFS
jgi:hypothetical protein